MSPWRRQVVFLYFYLECLFYQQRPRRGLWHHPGLFLEIGRLLATLNHQLLIRCVKWQYLGRGLYSTAGGVAQDPMAVVVGGLAWPNFCAVFIHSVLGYVRRVVGPETRVLLYLPPESVYGQLPATCHSGCAFESHIDRLLACLVRSGVIRSLEGSGSLHFFGHSYGTTLVHGIRQRFPTATLRVRTELWEPIAFRTHAVCWDRLLSGTLPIHPTVPVSWGTSLRQWMLLYLLHYGPFADIGTSMFEAGLDTSEVRGNVRVFCGKEDQLQCLSHQTIPESVVVLPGAWHGGFLLWLSGLGGPSGSLDSM